MITFHEISRIIQKMAVLSSHIMQLNQILPRVIQLSEKIDSLNEDLTVERDRMTAKIRSVEILGEILKTHVYQQTSGAGLNGLTVEKESIQRQTVEDEPSPNAGERQCEEVRPDLSGGNQGFFHPKLDGSSLML